MGLRCPKCRVWKEALRVLKPGGYALIACGTRTQHRMAVNIEDAGFEIRDMILYVYGSGFPKSLNVSKQLDKMAGAEREVVGKSVHSANRKHGGIFVGEDEGSRTITAPATPEAKQWEGFGTALKPAVECFSLARKPLSEKNVALNVLKWGTGVINVDGCRIELQGDEKPSGSGNQKHNGSTWTLSGKEPEKNITPETGRFPANLCHDGSDEVVRLFPNTKSGKATGYDWGEGNNDNPTHIAHNIKSGVHFGDSGSAARFFKEIKKDCLCFLCGLPLNENIAILKESNVELNQGKSQCKENANGVEKCTNQTGSLKGSVQESVQESIQQSCEGKNPSKDRPALIVEKSSTNTQPTEKSIVPENVSMQHKEQYVQNVKSAGNLCDLCATTIAQSIAAMQQDQSPDLHLGKAFISEHKKQILIQNLALLAENLESIDTIPTISSLKLLFGSVQHAIESFTVGLIEESCPKRFQYQSKASKSERNAGLEDFDKKEGAGSYHFRTDGSLDGKATQPKANDHSTVKPLKLMRYLCRLVTPPGGIVLDCFLGSGSTACAAVLEGFRYVGIEQDRHYCDISEARIKHWAKVAETERLSQGVLNLK
jgi:DNA modification methylase